MARASGVALAKLEWGGGAQTKKDLVLVTVFSMVKY